MPTPLCMECQHLTCTNYSLPRILLFVWFYLLFAIFQQMSDLVTSTGFLSTTEYSSYRYTYLYDLGNLSSILSLQSPPTTRAITSSPFFNPATTPSTIYVNVGAPSATALLQHGIPFLPPSKTVRPYIVSSAT